MWTLIGQDDDYTATVQSQPLARDVFRIRQIQKARAGTTSQTGSASYGSALSGDLSGSTGWGAFPSPSRFYFCSTFIIIFLDLDVNYSLAFQ